MGSSPHIWGASHDKLNPYFAPRIASVLTTFENIHARDRTGKLIISAFVEELSITVLWKCHSTTCPTAADLSSQAEVPAELPSGAGLSQVSADL